MTNTDAVVHTFDTEPDPDVWNVVNAVIDNGAAVFDPSVSGYVTSPTGISLAGPPAIEMYDFTSVYFVGLVEPTGALFVGTQSRTWIYGSNTHTCGFEVGPYPTGADPLHIRTAVTISGTTTYSARVPYDPLAHRWLKVSVAGTSITFETRASAIGTWSLFDTFTDAAVSSWPQVRIWTSGTRCALWAINTTVGTDPPPVYGDPDYDPVGTQPGDAPDLFNPDVTVPAEPIPPECQTLLEMVKAFSLLVKRAVRITGPNSIEMVNPNAPLPTGWYVEDADEMAHTVDHAITAGAGTVSYAPEDLEMTASATLVKNDVRLLVSGWRIPDRVPAYLLGAAPVKRVTHTFTPKGYTASVEYYVSVVPDTVRRH